MPRCAAPKNVFVLLALWPSVEPAACDVTRQVDRADRRFSATLARPRRYGSCPFRYVVILVGADVIVGGENFDGWRACGAQRPRRYTPWRHLRGLGRRPSSRTHVWLFSFWRRGGSGRGRDDLVGLRSQTVKEVHHLVASMAPGLAP